MSYIPNEECLPKAKMSAYKLALMAARRGRALSEGEKSTKKFDPDKPLLVVFDEIAEGKIKITDK